MKNKSLDMPENESGTFQDYAVRLFNSLELTKRNTFQINVKLIELEDKNKFKKHPFIWK